MFAFHTKNIKKFVIEKGTLILVIPSIILELNNFCIRVSFENLIILFITVNIQDVHHIDLDIPGENFS